MNALCCDAMLKVTRSKHDTERKVLGSEDLIRKFQGVWATIIKTGMIVKCWCIAMCSSEINNVQTYPLHLMVDLSHIRGQILPRELQRLHLKRKWWRYVYSYLEYW